MTNTQTPAPARIRTRTDHSRTQSAKRATIARRQARALKRIETGVIQTAEVR